MGASANLQKQETRRSQGGASGSATLWTNSGFQRSNLMPWASGSSRLQLMVLVWRRM